MNKIVAVVMPILFPSYCPNVHLVTSADLNPQNLMWWGSIQKIYNFPIPDIESEHCTRDLTQIKSADERYMLMRPRSHV